MSSTRVQVWDELENEELDDDTVFITSTRLPSPTTTSFFSSSPHTTTTTNTNTSFPRPTSQPLFSPLRRGVAPQDRQRGMKFNKNSDNPEESHTLSLSRFKDKGKGKESNRRPEQFNNPSRFSREHYVPHYGGSTTNTPHDRNRPSSANDAINGRSKFRGSLLVAASDALSFKFAKRRSPPVNRQQPNSIILPGVIDIGLFQDDELEERNRLREMAAQAIGLRPYVPSESHSKDDSSVTEDEDEDQTPRVPNIPGRSPHTSSLSVTVPGSHYNSSYGHGRFRSGSMIVPNSTQYTSYAPTLPIPPFPATVAALTPFRTSSGVYPKYYPPSSLRIFALSKSWKARFLVLTSPTHLVTRGRGPAVSYLHLFKSSNPDDRELERLEINEHSVTFVAEEEVGGKKQVIKVGGVDVGAMRREYLHEEGGHTMWLLHINDPQDAQNWITNIKNSILGQRTVRAGLMPAHTSATNEPRGDMDVMLSIRAQGLVTSPLPTPTSPTKTIPPKSPTLSTHGDPKANYAPSESSQSGQSHASPKQPMASNAVSALKGLFNSTRPRSASRAASIDSERFQDRDTGEGAFASIGTNLLSMLRSGTPDLQTPVTVPSSPIPQHSSPLGGQIERRLDHRIMADRTPMQWSSAEPSTNGKDRANKALSLDAMSLQPPPRKRWTSVGPGNFPTMDILPDDPHATITRTNFSLSRMSSEKDEGEMPPCPGSPTSFSFGSPEQRSRAPSLQSVSTLASTDQRVSFEQSSVSTKRSSGTRSARRWSRQLPARSNAPTDPPPAIPSQIGVHPFASEPHPSPISANGSPHSLISGLPIFSKRHSGSSAFSFNSTSTHSHSFPSSSPSATSNNNNPLPITIRPPSAHRVSMPPPRPAPTTALPPAPVDDFTTNDSTPQPSKSTIRNSMHRSFRIPIIAPKPPPSTTLPPRPDEITQAHRRSSSFGNGAMYPTILESIPASPVPAPIVPLKAGNPFPPPLGPLPPTPPTPPILANKRTTSIKQRLRILSAPSSSNAAKLQLPRPNTILALPHYLPTMSPPTTPIAEKITLFQNDPSFLQMSTPTIDPLTPTLTLFMPAQPEPETGELTSLSPPPRRASKQLLDTDFDALSRRQHREPEPKHPPQPETIPEDQLFDVMELTSHLSLSRPGSPQSLRVIQADPIVDTDLESIKDVSSLHDTLDDKFHSPMDSPRHFSSRHGSVISLGIVSL